jgi:hypothetical protein
MMIVPRGLGGSKLSGGARRLDERKSPDGDLTRTLARALLHDALDGRVTAAATGSRARAFSDRFDRARPFERAGANRSVRHGMAVANDHGGLPKKKPGTTEKDFQYHFQVADDFDVKSAG